MNNRDNFSRQLDDVERRIHSARLDVPVWKSRLANYTETEARLQREATKLKAMKIAGLPVSWNLKETEEGINDYHRHIAQAKEKLHTYEKTVFEGEIRRAELLAILPEFGGYLDPPPPEKSRWWDVDY